LKAYEKQRIEYTKREVQKLKLTAEYRSMVKKKGKKECNWNWQVWENYYGEISETSDEERLRK
jgi:hypothetical protein